LPIDAPTNNALFATIPLRTIERIQRARFLLFLYFPLLLIFLFARARDPLFLPFPFARVRRVRIASLPFTVLYLQSVYRENFSNIHATRPFSRQHRPWNKMSLARRRTFPLSWPSFIYPLTYPPVQALPFPLLSRVRVSADRYSGKPVKSLHLPCIRDLRPVCRENYQPVIIRICNVKNVALRYVTLNT
jgi:hypothetical protein